ncbi:MAG: dTDP-4-amino-4,6-dideoxygalactose transaminase [Nitrospinae bacterium]|nr:dTDP-4-amino-4,6-dideoxygalactose transaminase [Nitrospinota bacterium]
MHIPFNVPYMTERALTYIAEAHAAGHLSGDGPFTKKCQSWLTNRVGSAAALLTTSATSALEMAAILLDVGPGDEVIVPSFTFVSTANAFVTRGATPVFVDVRPDTLNMNEMLLEQAITPRTKAIVPVHYAGVGCEMDEIMAVAARHGVAVVEDAAQGILASYRGRELGGIGGLGVYSFHESKNVIAGEGGALLVNDPAFAKRAEIVWEKGTDRRAFYRGAVDKYTWRDVGSSFLPSELVAALLWSQIEEAEAITRRRMRVWETYRRILAPEASRLGVEIMTVPPHCAHNAHLFYFLLPRAATRGGFIKAMGERGIGCAFHYVPLHDSPGGVKFGRCAGPLPVTEDRAARLVRLPLWVGLEERAEEVALAAVEELERLA